MPRPTRKEPCTPGPWRRERFCIVSPDGESVATLVPVRRQYAVGEPPDFAGNFRHCTADADLLTAAPVLYELVLDAADALEKLGDTASANNLRAQLRARVPTEN